MEMELACTGTDEFVGSSNVNDATQILIKGKRTKRQRPLSPSPCAVNVAVAVATNTNHTMITSSSSSASEEGTHVISGGGGGDYGSFSSTTTTYESTEEEEDMANCLILLAQGVAGSPRLHKFNHPHQLQGEAANTYNNKTEQKGSSSSSSRIRFAEMATVSATASSKIGFYIYECKTCNRTFPSFQALGGHRASHKKPKVSSLDEKKPPPSSPPLTLPQPNYDFQEAAQGQPLTHIKTGPHQISLQLPSNRSGFNSNNKAAKIHECSICGSEFTSGQALGGHMRRHRASTRTSSDQVAPGMGPIEATSCNTSTAVNVQVKPRNILQLDLNLPAPEDDLRESKFQFTPTQKTLVLSAPALVDCHY